MGLKARSARPPGRNSGAWLAIALVTWVVTSCANVSVRRVDPSKPGEPTAGVRFYRPQPYLLVRIDDKGVATAQVVQLPDRDQEHLIEWSPGFGSVKPNFQLTDGWNLTSMASEVNSGTGAVAELITAVSGIVARAAPGAPSVEVSLFRLIWVKGSGKHPGYWKIGKATSTDRIPAPTPPASSATPQGSTR